MTLEELSIITNYHTLKRTALGLNIAVSDEDKGRDIKDKIEKFLKSNISLSTDTESIPEYVTNVPESIMQQPTKIITFTYIGRGTDVPEHIKFMGQINFTRGEPVPLDLTESNKHIIMKLQNNPCFVQGVVESDLMTRLDQEAIARAKRIEGENRAMDAAFFKKHK